MHEDSFLDTAYEDRTALDFPGELPDEGPGDDMSEFDGEPEPEPERREREDAEFEPGPTGDEDWRGETEDFNDGEFW